MSAVGSWTKPRRLSTVPPNYLDSQEASMTQAQPVTFQQLLDEHAPDLAAVVAGARSSLTDDGALSSKVKTLMMMICDSLLNHESGVTNLANRARSLGASEDEIKEALGVAYLMGGLPAVVAGSNAFRNIQRG